MSKEIVLKKGKDDYDIKDIRTLKGMEAIRLRPGMFIGSVGPEGVKHITLEIISNAIDEYLNGHCTECIITVHPTKNEITISDNGRGVPFGKAEDGSETLENIFTKLHTGAKFDSSGKTGYNTSGGMNGVGAKATNALSSHFSVVSCRDGKIATMKFEKGIRTSFVVTDGKTQTTGTTVTFSPDEAIFKEGTDIDYDALKKQIQELSFLSPGLIFKLTFKEKPEEIITSQRGILDYLDYINTGVAETKKMFASSVEDRTKVEIALMYNNKFSETYKLYTNAIPNSGGTHLTGFRTALTSAINEYAREKKLLKEKDNNFTGDDLKEGMLLVLSILTPDPVFSGQTKDVLTSSEIRGIVQRVAAKEIKTWLNSNPKDAKTIISKALLARKARESAKKARDTIRKTETKSSMRVMLPGKLADCSSKKREECEVFLVEGDSAAGTAKDARDRGTQAILALRGKVLNCEKISFVKAIENKEIQTMISAFGLELTKTGINVNKNKLRYGKIITLSDSDCDGDHIRVLILTFLWKYAPELIEKGYVYAAQPPLYRIIKGTTSVYLSDDAALEEYRKTHASGYIVSRFKGIGEMSVDELYETVMDKKQRVLKKITAEDAEKTSVMFDKLMGTKVIGRKNFISENADKVDINI